MPLSRTPMAWRASSQKMSIEDVPAVVESPDGGSGC
jgi:hypothetical protein